MRYIFETIAIFITTILGFWATLIPAAIILAVFGFVLYKSSDYPWLKWIFGAIILICVLLVWLF